MGKIERFPGGKSRGEVEVILFSAIEKEYKKGLQERRFFRFYWPRAIIIVALALALDLGMNFNRWIIYGVMVLVLILLVLLFFFREWRRGISRVEPEKLRQTARRHHIKVFHKADDEIRINNLVDDLRRHNIRTKSDLELAINYFERSRPVASKPNLLEWTLSIAVTLSSIVLLAYDTETGVINAQKFISAFGSTMTIALVVLTPAIIAKFISARISAARTKVDSFLTEDLAFIYVNYDQYKKQLER